MRKLDSLRWRLLWHLTLMLVVLMLASSLSAWFNGREAADTAYDRTLLASARVPGLVEASTNAFQVFWSPPLLRWVQM